MILRSCKTWKGPPGHFKGAPQCPRTLGRACAPLRVKAGLAFPLPGFPPLICCLSAAGRPRQSHPGLRSQSAWVTDFRDANQHQLSLTLSHQCDLFCKTTIQTGWEGQCLTFLCYSITSPSDPFLHFISIGDFFPFLHF